MLYYLMRKDTKLALLNIDDNGQVIKYNIIDIDSPELPLAHKCEPNYLIRWWNDRSIPLTRGKVDEMLKEKGLLDPKKYLLNNLALSLTDYYWIKPIDSDYNWKQVNLFENNFKDDMHIFNRTGSNTDAFTPNSSLQGDLEKTWLIMKNKRVLVKGNHNSLSQESINEVIASEFHKKQGFNNYVEYSLLEVNEEYKYACYCDCFTNNDVEFVSAYDLLTSEVKPNNVSSYEQLILLAKKHGINENELRDELEYQIMSDYILSNIDRHMYNIGFLRDSKSLKFISMAPIFDTGNSLFNDSPIPNNLDKLDINSFVKKEDKMLSYITKPDLLNVNKILDVNVIKKYYSKDPNMSAERINDICNAYIRKIELFKAKMKHIKQKA